MGPGPRPHTSPRHTGRWCRTGRTPVRGGRGAGAGRRTGRGTAGRSRPGSYAPARWSIALNTPVIITSVLLSINIQCQSYTNIESILMCLVGQFQCNMFWCCGVAPPVNIQCKHSDGLTEESQEAVPAGPPRLRICRGRHFTFYWVSHKYVGLKPTGGLSRKKT